MLGKVRSDVKHIESHRRSSIDFYMHWISPRIIQIRFRRTGPKTESTQTLTLKSRVLSAEMHKCSSVALTLLETLCVCMF